MGPPLSLKHDLRRFREKDANGRHTSFAGFQRTVRIILPYIYGRIVCMKKTLHIDDDLLRDARSACGASTDTDTVRLGLEALIRQAAYQRIRALRGSEPGARQIPRRRERPSSGASSAS